MTDPTATARELVRVRAHRGQAGPRQLDGRDGRRRGRGDPPRGRDPDLRVPRRRGEDLQLHVAARPQPAPDLRDADAPVGRGAPGRPGPGRGAHRRGPGRGPDAAHRGRVEGAPGGLRHPDHGDGGRPDDRRGGRGCRPDRLPGRRQALLPHDHPQDRRRRRPAQPQGRGRRAPRVRAHPGLGDREEGRRALRGRHRPADGQLDRLRAHPRQLDRPAVRAGAPLRDGRPARRGLQGPRPRPAARSPRRSPGG